MDHQLHLVERAKRGDHDAFAALATASARRLLGASRLILGSPELAQDATQDALIRAWRDLPALRDPARFDAWLHRLTVNACLDIARRRRRRPAEVDLAYFDATIGDQASQLADRQLLEQALQELEPGWRAVIVLHYYLDLPLTEVAAALQIPVGTAKSRLNRSLVTLRTALTGSDSAADSIREGQLA